MRYHTLGEVPPKRHTQIRDGGRLLTEEVLGFEGFSGNESTLYHLWEPTRIKDVGRFHPIEREEWIPPTHVHRHTRTAPVPSAGEPLTSERLLFFNADVEISVAKPTETSERFLRNGEGDEVIFVQEGGGTLHSVFGSVPFRHHDYVVIPRGTTYRFELDGPQFWLKFFTPGEIETPKRYRNRYGQLLEHAPYSARDFHPPASLELHRERGEFSLTLRVRDGYQDYVLDHHPFDVVGWDGYVYPYTFNVADFEPVTGRIHQPPPVHQTFQGQNFVICSFCPRELDYDPLAVPVPYHHSNLQSEEVMFYASGEFGSRKGIEIASITLHPSGLPHGPQPGLQRSRWASGEPKSWRSCATPSGRFG